MKSMFTPFQLKLDVSTFSELQLIQHVKRYLGDMPGYFHDQQAVATLLTKDNPLIYEYWEIPNDGSSLISISMTRIAAGVVGDEYFMTKGHFHTLEEDGEEIYFVLQGLGYVLLQNRDGERQTLNLSPENLYYVPKGWAHRAVNCGEEDLKFVSLWPNSVGHDYKSIELGGFPQLIVKGTHGPSVIQNGHYHSYQTL